MTYAFKPCRWQTSRAISAVMGLSGGWRIKRSVSRNPSSEKDIQTGTLLELHGQTLLERQVEDRIAGLVDEIGQ